MASVVDDGQPVAVPAGAEAGIARVDLTLEVARGHGRQGPVGADEAPQVQFVPDAAGVPVVEGEVHRIVHPQRVRQGLEEGAAGPRGRADPEALGMLGQLPVHEVQLGLGPFGRLVEVGLGLIILPRLVGLLPEVPVRSHQQATGEA